jgi:hypothetical protein
MKKIAVNINHLLLMLVLTASCLALFSCEKDQVGPPTIERVRLLDSTKRDSFFVSSLPGTIVVIQGQGFNGLLKVYFNEFDAPFNIALNTDKNITILIPEDAPTEATDPNVTNNIRIITDHGEATYQFSIVAPPPAITGASNENALPGAEIVLTGTNLYLLSDITFPGGIAATNFTANADGTEVTVTVPAGVTTGGVINITGQFGSGISSFVFNNIKAPTTGFLANFEDGDPYFGWQWWGGIKSNNASAFPGNTGNYIEIKPGTINAGDGSWYSDNRAVMVDSDPWVATADMDEPIDNYALKFEIYVKNAWKNGSIMIVPNGNFNIMARYAPWETSSSGQFITTGWRTVTIPLSRFLSGTGSYNPSGTPPANFAALTGGSNSTSVQLMLFNDSTTPLSNFNAAVDNVRIVKVK